MSISTLEKPKYPIKTPKNLSPRIQWLRDYYFQGTKRKWNNEFTAWTTGASWDFQYHELTFYIVPETYFYLPTFRSSFKQTARPVTLPQGFWDWSIAERRAWFVKAVMVDYLPQEILPGDLIAGHPNLRLPERAGDERIRPAGAGQGRRPPGTVMVPQPRLRQHRRHQWASHP